MTSGTHYHVQACAYSDVGRLRSSNEDSFFIANLSEGLHLEQNGTLQFRSGRFGSLYAVADGMGGAAGGEVASRIGVWALYRVVQELVGRIGSPRESVLEEILIEAVGAANDEIYEMSNRNHDLRGMGTTLTAVLEFQGRLLVGQIGDSRAYLVRGDEIVRLTRDQSLVEHKVSTGEITREEARHHRHRNVLLQALGIGAKVELALRSLSVELGDILVLCSDGLHSQMSDEELLDVVVESTSPEDACNGLIDLANHRGGPDNITVLLTRFLPRDDSEWM